MMAMMMMMIMMMVMIMMMMMMMMVLILPLWRGWPALLWLWQDSHTGKQHSTHWCFSNPGFYTSSWYAANTKYKVYHLPWQGMGTIGSLDLSATIRAAKGWHCCFAFTAGNFLSNLLCLAKCNDNSLQCCYCSALSCYLMKHVNTNWPEQTR